MTGLQPLRRQCAMAGRRRLLDQIQLVTPPVTVYLVAPLQARKKKKEIHELLSPQP